MSLKTAYDNLATLLTGDIDIKALLGASLTVIRGNQEVSRLRPNEMPALILEMGESDLETVVGGHESQGTNEMRISFVWHQKNNATAFGERLDLVPLVTRALLGDETLSGAVAGASVGAVRPDLGMNHPIHAVQFTVNADIEITRG